MADNGFTQAGRGQTMPESIKARLTAARLLQQSASSQTGPYTSGGVTALKAVEGLMGGLQEKAALDEVTQGQAAHRQAIASLLMGTALGPSVASGSAPMSAAAPLGQGGIGSDRAASPGDGSTRDLAIRTIYGEAGGEPSQGQAGVAAVLKNRLASGQYGNDMRGVILAPKQFSLWNAGDPAGDSARRLSPDSASYRNIGAIYDGVMSGQVPDPTGGATHYYNPRAASPAWGPKLAAQNDVMIGNHRFVGSGPAGPNGAASVASSSPAPSSDRIGDAAALAAENRVRSGTGSDADRALLVSYRQQQNAPLPDRSAAAAPAGRFYIGDSIGQGLARADGASGATRVGASPQAVLASIQGLDPQALAGRHIVLSGGASNAPGSASIVGDQIAALQRKGVDPSNITVVGVGGRPDFAGINDQLAAIAQRSGATFGGPVQAGADGVHPADYRSALGALASGDLPARNAQPAGSNVLPPDVTPDMVSGKPSPYGAMPTSMRQAPANPQAAALAAMLRGTASGSGPGATPLPASVQPSSPYGAMPTSMDQAPASVPTPLLAGSPPPAPQPSPFGAGPQPMAPGGAMPEQRALAAALMRKGTGEPSSAPSGAGDLVAPVSAAAPNLGSPTVQDASTAPPPPVVPMSRGNTGGKPSIDARTTAAMAAAGYDTSGLPGDLPALAGLGLGGDLSGMAKQAAAIPPVQASGLSTSTLPGMDNFSVDSSVRQSSLGAAGFTGAPTDGSVQADMNGDLRGPDAYVGGPLGLGTGPGQQQPQAPASPLASSILAGGPSPRATLPATVPAQGAPAPNSVSLAGPQNAGDALDMVEGTGSAAYDGRGTPKLPLPDITTTAMAKAGYDTAGLPGAPAAPSPNGKSGPTPDPSGLGAPPVPPPAPGLPVFATKAANPPAAVQQIATDISAPPIAATLPEPSSRPGAQAARNAAVGVQAPSSNLPPVGPMPVQGAQSASPGSPISLGPSAPAPGAAQAGPQPVPASVMARALAPQTFGGSGTDAPAGNSAVVDPSSPQNFQRQEAARAGGMSASALGRLVGGAAPSAAPPSGSGPLDMLGGGIGSLLGGLMGGQSQSGGPGSVLGGLTGGQGQGGSLAGIPLLGGLMGGGGTSPGLPFGGQAQSAATGSASPAVGQGVGQSQSATGQMDTQRAQMLALLGNPYTTPAEEQFILGRLYPQPEKVAAGDGLVIRNPDGSVRNLYTQPSKDVWAVTPDGTGKLNKATGDVVPLYGNGSGNPGGWRPMTPAELQRYGVNDGRPAYIAPNGEPHFGMPGAQGQGESEEAKESGKAAAGRQNDMVAAANAAPLKIARLDLIGKVLDNTQTGPLAGETGTAASVATRLGIAPERLAQIGIDPNQPVNNQVANKLAGEMTMSSIGAKNGGMPASNFSVAERQFIEALYPNIENQPGANRMVIDVLRTVEQRNAQIANAWADYKDQQRAGGKPLSYADFEDSFRRSHAGDNIFAPILQRYQAGGYTPTVPTPGGVPGQGASPPASARGASAGPPAGLTAPASPTPQGAPAGQGGGYLPGAARGPAQAAPQGQATPAPQGQGSDPLSQARAALAKGAPRAAVIQRLQGMGIDTRGL